MRGLALLPTQAPSAFMAHVLSDDRLTLPLEAGRLVAGLSVEQKVAQLFFVTPESLFDGGKTVMAAGPATRQALAQRPVGGLIYFERNLVNADQTTAMLSATSAYALEACGIPILLGVDEEGGTVSRIGGNEGFGIADVGNMSDVGATGDVDRARQIGADVGAYLHQLGFSADFAPVADVVNNPKSDTMALRSFGSDATLVSQMVVAEIEGLSSQGILACAKHFPGIGGAVGDSHEGAIYSDKTAEQMGEEELLPFKAAIDAGVPMVMVSHMSCPGLGTGDLPASVSPAVMRDLLRDRMGFEGVIMTDSLQMGAIASLYPPEREGVEAFLAGADVLLMPVDFEAAYQGMLDAVESGEVTQERLQASVWRIALMKLRAGRS